MQPALRREADASPSKVASLDKVEEKGVSVPKSAAYSEEMLRRVFEPRSIAVIGASVQPTRIGGRPVEATIRAGFDGAIYPVNPKYDEVQGLRCFDDLESIGSAVDLVVVAVGKTQVRKAVEDAAAAGAGGVVLFSSGYAELSQEGRDEQEELDRICRSRGVVLIGPNCLGLVNTDTGVMATFTATLESGPIPKGSIGFACQSGAFGSYFLALARERDLGVKYWVATGNEAGLTVADAISYMAADPNVTVISGYIEGTAGGEALLHALSKAQRMHKPVVLLKAGRSEAGARAATSHTGSMVGDDAVFDAIFERYDVHRARDLEELLDITEALSFGILPAQGRAAVLTVSGGVGIMMADEAADLDLALPPPSERLASELRALVPFAGLENPIDFTGQFLNDASIAGSFLECVAGSGEYDAIVIFLGHTSLAESLAAPAIDEICRLRGEYPDVAIVFSGLASPKLRTSMREAGIPVLSNPISAVRVVHATSSLGSVRLSPAELRLEEQIDGSTDLVELGERTLSERRSLELLGVAGVPIVASVLVHSVVESIEAAKRIGFPVVMKVEKEGVAHKSELGGVFLGVDSPRAVEDAFVAISKLFGEDERTACIVQEMVEGDLEVILGAKRDENFGPLVLVGTGGVLAEAFSDVALALAPLRDERAALALLGRTAIGRALLPGGRFAGRYDLTALAAAILNLSAFVARHGSIVEVDVNPVKLEAHGRVRAVDALITLGT